MDKNSDFKTAVNWYLSNFATFEASLNGGAESALHETRKDAIEKFSNLGFPTTKDEEWKYTNVAPLLAHQFGLPKDDVSISPELVQTLLFDSTRNSALVFVNGRYSAELSTLHRLDDGVVVGSLGQAFQTHPDLVARHLGKYANSAEESFIALNTSFLTDGLFVHVPDNLQVEETLHLLHIADGQTGAFAAHPRVLMVIGKNSRVKLVESHFGNGEGVYLNNPVGEIYIDEGGRFEHTRVQEETAKAYHISNYYIHQEKDSVFSTLNVDLGGSLVRNNLSILLNGPNCETHLFGFFMGSESQHFDNHTFIDHAQPHCFSNELYKGILDDRARGVFSGKILVRQDAQKTNALQSNKTLLLTDDATINAKPQLEIFADDVKCTHGATIGQLDDEALFYLRARGISEDMAGAMLRHAFVADVLENAWDEGVRARLDAKVIERFTK